MIVQLNRIEQLNNGSAHIVFNTESDSQFSFIVPKAFAATPCKYIIENTFYPGNELNIEFVTWERTNKESMIITSTSAVDDFKTKLQLTQYTRDKE